mgnify:FL=1
MISCAVAMVAIFAFGIIAIDGSILVTTKTQLQNAADAAALAGAAGLVSGDQGLATQNAILFAGLNNAVQNDIQPVVIDSTDVTFPTATRIRVETHRTAATGDPLRTYFLRIVDLAAANTADVRAVAEAEIYDVCATNCLKPWAIADRWQDNNGNGSFDTGTDFYDPVATGYQAPGDVGTPITLKIGNPQATVVPGHFWAINYPPLGGPEAPITGANQYRHWIANCASYIIAPGDELQVEPGNMKGPTRQGVQGLTDLDPGAYWDNATNTVQGSAYATSPRIGLVPFVDPTIREAGGRSSVIVVKIGAFFIESINAQGDVTGRFMQVAAPGEACENGGAGFIKGLHLVQ